MAQIPPVKVPISRKGMTARRNKWNLARIVEVRSGLTQEVEDKPHCPVSPDKRMAYLQIMLITMEQQRKLGLFHALFLK